MYITKVVRLLHTRTFLMTIKKSRFFTAASRPRARKGRLKLCVSSGMFRLRVAICSRSHSHVTMLSFSSVVARTSANGPTIAVPLHAVRGRRFRRSLVARGRARQHEALVIDGARPL